MAPPAVNYVVKQKSLFTHDLVTESKKVLESQDSTYHEQMAECHPPLVLHNFFLISKSFSKSFHFSAQA